MKAIHLQLKRGSFVFLPRWFVTWFGFLMLTSDMPHGGGYRTAIDNLFRAQSKAAVTNAIYVIAGTALSISAVASLAASEWVHAHTGISAYAVLGTAALWWAVGGVVMHQHNRSIQTFTRTYNHYVPQRDPYAPEFVPSQHCAAPVSDAPWELRAFFKQAQQTSAAAVHGPVYTLDPAPSASCTTQATAPNKPLRRPAQPVANGYERPVSLFGAYQGRIAGHH